MKVVVFDLDETLGYFVEFGIFWDSLTLYVSKYLNKELNQNDFNTIMDLYPEILRPNIITILNYLKNKKKNNCCQKLMIYTNNQGSQKWCQHIISYFENKINYKLFDQIISAFKINGKQIEICRTTHSKTYSDLMRCTKLPVNSEICYIDDSYFPEMVKDNIYYINIKPYVYNIPFNEMNKRFLDNRNTITTLIINQKLQDEFIDFMDKNIKMYNFKIINKNVNEYEVDKILSKKILIHLEDFFDKSDSNHNTNLNTNKCKTRRRNNKPKNKSNKKKNY